MTIYHKYLLTWAVLFASEFLVMSLVFDKSYGIFMFFGILGIGSFIIHGIVCPRCDTSIGYGGRFKGLGMPRSFFDTRCNECGQDLNER
ncbi:MAG: hypothetical protein ABIZ09_15815 [Rhodoferax sp.]